MSQVFLKRHICGHLILHCYHSDTDSRYQKKKKKRKKMTKNHPLSCHRQLPWIFMMLIHPCGAFKEHPELMRASQAGGERVSRTICHAPRETASCQRTPLWHDKGGKSRTSFIRDSYPNLNKLLALYGSFPQNERWRGPCHNILCLPRPNGHEGQQA